MQDIVKWLKKVEHLANEVYEQAASIYADDSEFNRFLKHLAEDEAWHFHVMGSAEAYFLKNESILSAIAVDQEIKDKILNYFIHLKARLDQNSILKNELIEKIVEVEFSEWNDIFYYIVDVLKEKTKEFKYPAARIQAHIKGIEYFLEKTEVRSEVLDKIASLPPVWVENILIVDDEQMIADLLKALLNRSGNIDVAHDGQEAMALIERKFYKLILSDIDMPKMDGLSLFNKAVAKYPKLKNRFLFMTGSVSPEKQAFFDEHNLQCIEKPMHINALREEVAKIVLSN